MLSVIEQIYPNIEIIVVDNNSTDGSLEIAERIAKTDRRRPIQVTKCAVQGANSARNWGYRFAHGEFIQWMDADDSLDPEKIALQVKALQQNSGDDIAYGDWTARWIKPAKPRAEQPRKLQQVDDQLLRTLAGIWYPPHLYLLRRSAAQQLQKVQGWWPARKVATDIEYSAIAALLGLRFRHVAGAHVYYNIWSTTQISGGTPYAERVAALAAIFLRLQQFAASDQTKAALTSRHRILLNQNWQVWSLPRNTAFLTELPDRRFRLRDAQTGNEVELQPWEAAIAMALMAAPRPLTSFHYALLLTEAAKTTNDPVLIVQTIERLQREGFLRPATGEHTALAM
jgi:hypothetical protein